MQGAVTKDDVVVHASGPTTPRDLDYARRKIASVLPLAPGAVLFAKADLVVHADPAREQPAFAKAELDLDGLFVRAHATGSTVTEAVDGLESRLRERLERALDREESKHLRHRGDHGWRHGDEPTPRRPFYPRPVEERTVVRRKTFAIEALTTEQASIEMEQLDHDFYLFTNAVTGDDNVIFRTGEGAYELIEPSREWSLGAQHDAGWAIRVSEVRPSVMTVDGAIDLLDLGDEPFVFYLDAPTGRGNVVYRRYDGHYGVIVPADGP